MSPSDDKQYPLISNTAAPRARRAISARDYTLPKPYRKKKFVEDEPPMSRLRIGLLAFSGLVIASLVGALVMLAKENLDSPPLPIVAAPKPASALPAALAMPPAAPQLALVRPAPALPAPAAVPTVHVRDEPPPAPRRAPPPRPEPAAPDPDVVLITAILMLTPPSAPVPADPTLVACSATPTADSGCPAIHGLKP